MELMDISMDKLYLTVHKTLDWKIPERIIGKITVSVSAQLHSLDYDTLTFCAGAQCTSLSEREAEDHPSRYSSTDL